MTDLHTLSHKRVALKTTPTLHSTNFRCISVVHCIILLYRIRNSGHSSMVMPLRCSWASERVKSAPRYIQCCTTLFQSRQHSSSFHEVQQSMPTVEIWSSAFKLKL
ncbi:hypothetical protein MRX96_002205 [Rhipicephalus microplus]